MKLNHLGAGLLSDCWRNCGKISAFCTDEVPVAENHDFKGKSAKWNVWHVEAKYFKIITFLFNFLEDSCKVYLFRRPEIDSKSIVAPVQS